MKGVETPESLWGEGKVDPTEALQRNNFQIVRKCFLINSPGLPTKGSAAEAREGKKGESKANMVTKRTVERRKKKQQIQKAKASRT